MIRRVWCRVGSPGKKHRTLKHTTVTFSMDNNLLTFWNQQWQQMSATWINHMHDSDLESWLASQPKRYLRVLEIGCGLGHNAAWMDRQGHDVVAIDISDVAIKICRDSWPNVDFRHADILDPTLDLGEFDLVFERGVMVVLKHAPDRSRLVSAAQRHMVPGGRYISVVDCSEQRRRDDPRLSHRSLSDIVDAVQPHLDIESIRSVVMPVPSHSIPAWFVVAAHKLI